MKSVFKLNNMKKVALLLVTIIVMSSCSSDNGIPVPIEVIPDITLTVTDCPTEHITVTPTVKVRQQSSGVWIVEITVNIKCMGEVVDQAELKLDYSWLSKDFKIKTNENGDAKGRQRIASSVKPTGSITITIEGSDGEEEQTVDF